MCTINEKNIREAFTRDALPDKPFNVECDILNHDVLSAKGTHWTCWSKNGKEVVTSVAMDYIRI